MNRRNVLAAIASLPITLTPLPLLAQNRGRARVKSVEAFAVRGAVFVKVTADDGTAGWGEAGHSGGRHVARVVRDEIADIVIGMDVFDAEGLWAKAYYEIDELGPGGIASQALAGVDCASWDLRGRLLGQPVWALFGGKLRDSFPVYGSYSRATDDGYMTPEQCGKRAAELVGEGFVAIKMRMAIREENIDPDPDPTIPCVRAVRAAIGPDIPLYVDANNGYRAARAIEVGKRLHGDFGVSVFEEPVAAYHYASMAQVSDALDMVVAAGEHEYTPWQFRDLIQQGKPDLLNPDVSKLSGLTAGRKVAALADMFDLPISVHNARPTLLTAAHAHFIASSHGATRPQEHPGARRLAHLWDYFEERVLPSNGRFVVPDTPGLGMRIIEAKVRAAAA